MSAALDYYTPAQRAALASLAREEWERDVWSTERRMGSTDWEAEGLEDLHPGITTFVRLTPDGSARFEEQLQKTGRLERCITTDEQVHTAVLHRHVNWGRYLQMKTTPLLVIRCGVASKTTRNLEKSLWEILQVRLFAQGHGPRIRATWLVAPREPTSRQAYGSDEFYEWIGENMQRVTR